MVYDLIYTRCRHGLDIMRSGQPLLSDGLKIYACSSALYKEKLVDLAYATYLMQEKQSFREPEFMDDAYIYAVPSRGLKMLNEFHPVPYDLSVTGDFAKRPGLYLNHAIASDFDTCYPCELFHDKNVWTAKEKNEAFYYEQEPTDLLPRELNIGKSFDKILLSVKNFINAERRIILKKAISFLISQYAKPENERLYLVIKGDSSEDVELWISAIEMAFSPRISANIPFATRMNSYASTNKYSVDNDGFFSTQQRSGNKAARVRSMIVGVIAKDKANNVRIFEGAPFVVLDGRNNTVTFDADISDKFYDLITAFDERQIRFTKGFLQSFEVQMPNPDVIKLASAYCTLNGLSSVDAKSYSDALGIMSGFKYHKTPVICEIYNDVKEKLKLFIKKDFVGSLPIINWIGEASEVVGDPNSRSSLSQIIKKKAEEVFFTEYRQASFVIFWNNICKGNFYPDVAEFLSDDKTLDDYSGVLRGYHYKDSVNFVIVYCVACKKRITEKDDFSKIVIANCVYAGQKSPNGNAYIEIVENLKKPLGKSAYGFFFESIKVYESDLLKTVARAITSSDYFTKASPEDGFGICKALLDVGLSEHSKLGMRDFIEASKNADRLRKIAQLTAENDVLSKDFREYVFELLDESVKPGRENTYTIAKIINENKPENAECLNAAHIAMMEEIRNLTPDKDAESLLSNYFKRGMPKVKSIQFAKDFASAILKSNTNAAGLEYIMATLVECADKTYLSTYIHSLIMSADTFNDKWVKTISFTYKNQSNIGRVMEKYIRKSLISSEMKKKEMETLSKYLPKREERIFYESIVEDAIETIKEKEPPLTSRLFGRFKK